VTGVADHVARRVAGFVARLVYRDIEVIAQRDPGPGPVLLVSNHFGGAADAVLLVHLSPRFPRIVARDVIWRVPVAGSVMRSVGAIPVHKAEDAGDGRSTNDAMFHSCYEALAEGALVMIFPEGVTQDDPRIAPVKTGAARIALGARAAGTESVVIQPVGIHYEDKAAFRSRVLLAFGEPISVDEVARALPEGTGPPDADNRAAVDALNERISAGMRAAAPDYRDWDEAREMQLAASVALREVSADDQQRETPLALREVLASTLAKRPDPVRSEVSRAARDYRKTLDGLRMSDYQLAGETSTGRLFGRLVVDGLVTAVLLPYAIAGLLLTILPVALTQATRLIPAAPAVRATIMPMVALLTFLLEWIWVGVSAGTRLGWQFGVLVALIAPAFVGATVLVGERIVLLWRTVRSWVAARRGSRPVRAARADRAVLLEAVRRAV
jgi:glycerol-3-phosphate O-acyltransferase/dihydroxyacetone phosphate acyltransferase